MDRDPSPGKAAAGLTALAHPAPLAVLCRLASQLCCRKVVAQFALAQPAVPQHRMAVEAGLARCEAKGRPSRHAVDREAIACVSRRFHQLPGRFGGAS